MRLADFRDQIEKADEASGMPIELRAQRRKLGKILWVAGLSPIAFLVSCNVMPESLLMAIAGWFNEVFWTHLKHFSLEDCAPKCRMLSFGVVSIAISWLATPLLIGWTAVVMLENWSTAQRGVRRGKAPFGRLPGGKAKRYPGYGTLTWTAATCGWALVGATAVGITWLLYEAAGSSGSAANFRRASPLLFSINLYVCIGISQFLLVTFTLATFGLALNAGEALREAARRRERHDLK